MHHSFFAEEEATSIKQDKPCFKCGESGHWKRDCKKGSLKGSGSKYKFTGGGNTQQTKPQKDISPPKNKKFHCAYHKDLPGRACSTWSCTAMKYIPFEERMKLLKENGDCESCSGDCVKGSCQYKNN